MCKSDSGNPLMSMGQGALQDAEPSTYANYDNTLTPPSMNAGKSPLDYAKKFAKGFAGSSGLSRQPAMPTPSTPIQVMNDIPSSQGNPAINTLLAQIMQRNGY